MREISSWQSGPEPINTRLPDALAVAGAFVLAFRKPDTIGDFFLLRPSAWIAQKEEKTASLWWNACEGLSGVPDDLVLSETAGARDKTFGFFQRLNRMACIDG